MLTDAELQAIAEEYVHARIPSCEAKRVCVVDNPSGVYFELRERHPREDFEQAPDDLCEWRLSREGVPKGIRSTKEDENRGFFIHRETGDMRVILDLELGGAHWSIDWGSVPDPLQVKTKPEHIRYVLTGAVHPNSYDPSFGPPRLTDHELHVIASEYINSQTSLRSHQPAAECALDDPPGVFFMALNTGEFEVVDEAQPPDFPVVRVEPVDQDHIGFFVHGISGEVRLISYREIMAAGWKVTMGRPEEIKRILTRVLRPRPWWKFW